MYETKREVLFHMAGMISTPLKTMAASLEDIDTAIADGKPAAEILGMYQGMTKAVLSDIARINEFITGELEE